LPAYLQAAGVALQGAAVRASVLRLLAAQYCLDACHYLACAERFADVVVGTELQAKQAIHFLDAGTDDDHRYPGLAPDSLAQIETIHTRQHQVEQYHVDVLLADALQDIPGIQTAFGDEAAVHRVGGQRCGNGGIGFDNQYACHVVFPAGAESSVGSSSVMCRPPSVEWAALSWAP